MFDLRAMSTDNTIGCAPHQANQSLITEVNNDIAQLTYSINTSNGIVASLVRLYQYQDLDRP